jgi:hypothetical protein
VFDPLSLVMGGALVAVGWFIGRIRKPKTVDPPVMRCSCGHGYGTHENGHKCNAAIHALRNGCSNTYDWVPCACLSYDGPDPLLRVWNT